jgi:predicted phosphohydrolase
MTRALHSSIDPSGQLDHSEWNRYSRDAWLGLSNDAHFEDGDTKIYEREIGRLRTASERSRPWSEFDALVVALHYPPTSADHHRPDSQS